MGYRRQLLKGLHDYIDKVKEAARQQNRPANVEYLRRVLGLQTDVESVHEETWNAFKAQVRELLQQVPKGERQKLRAVRAWIMDTARARSDPNYQRRLSSNPLEAPNFDDWWDLNKGIVRGILRER
jgi:hypothetical protein